MQKDSPEKNIKATAMDFARIGKWNYLAHTIREIEHRIYREKRITYHVVISENPMAKHMSTMYYYTAGCDIVLLDDCNKLSNKEMRLLLAHELGHVAYNINNIDAVQGWSYAASEEEELYAWKFAYFLLNHRSNDHKERVGKDYIYQDGQLEQLIVQIVNKGRPEIYEQIRAFLKTYGAL